MGVFLFAILLMTILGGIAVVAVLLFHPSLISERLLSRVQAQIPLLDTDPNRVRRTCQEVVRKLLKMRGLSDEAAALSAFDARSTGLRACALAEILAAVLEYREGQPQSANNRLEYVRQHVTDDRMKWQLLLQYYLLSGQTSSDAVQCFLAVLREPALADDVLLGGEHRCESIRRGWLAAASRVCCPAWDVR
jgi:hypothetical protein